MTKNGKIIIIRDRKRSLKNNNKNGIEKIRKMPAGLKAIAKPANTPALTKDVCDLDFAAKLIEARCAVKQRINI